MQTAPTGSGSLASTPRRHAAWTALAAPVTFSLLLPRHAAAHGLHLQASGGSGGPPGGSRGGGGGGGWGSSGGNGSSAALSRRLPQEAFQLAAAKKQPVTLMLASFAVTRKAYGKISKMFMREYEEQVGQPVRFRLSFAGSGTQARAVMDGLPADIVALALPLDIIKISERGLIRPDWATRFPNKSIVVESVVSIVVRKGNPLNIQGWDDLTREDVNVITANPKTAGVARWIFLALWGHRAWNKGEKAAKEFVTKVFDRVEVQPRDAREASDVFYKQGKGDALLTYENEAVFTNLVVSPNEKLPCIVPDNNVRIQCPVAIVDANVDPQPPEVKQTATAFLDYLYKAPAQHEFAACGFRSALPEVMKDSGLPSVRGLWTVEGKLGTWDKVQKKFFDDEGILSEIQRDVSQRKLAAMLQRR
ncbi:hypothetical protein N2152v2_006399 [Parachlorella kessleri]|uniref:Sulfate transport system substrate-binding protein n=1 Tax=Parachlorella kessleri TaxID=3074 RepID=A0A146HU56_PARKE|nr:sulfate transport system substrate-binding protein [Parachlorella kessleri]